MTDTDAAGTISAVSSAVNVTVDTHVPNIPLVKLFAAASNSVTGTLSLQVSADHYLGDPQFQVFVDGHQLGGIQSVQAVHSDGQWQNINFTGSFDPNAAHQVIVKFINDAWDDTGGGEGHDRNIYVGDVSTGSQVIEGAHTTSDTASLGYVDP